MKTHTGIPVSDRGDAGRSARPSVRELEVLNAVIATRKTTAAAQRLGISQPAVSRAIGALEARLKRPLFLRDGGRLVPTADAFALDAEAAPIFAALARLEDWPPAPEPASQLRIATTATLAHMFLASVIARFHALEPETRIQVEIGKSPDAVSAIADGSADLGIVDATVAHAGVRAEPFHRSVAHCLMAADHALARKARIGPADLARQPMIALTRRFSLRARFDSAFADAGFAPAIVMEAATGELVVELVKAGVGLAILNPFAIASSLDKALALRPFDPAIACETSFLLPAAGAGLAVARRFADFVRAGQADARPG